MQPASRRCGQRPSVWRADYGHGLEFWPAERVRDRLAHRTLSRRPVRCRRLPHPPLNYCLGLAAEASRLGARLYEKTPAVAWICTSLRRLVRRRRGRSGAIVSFFAARPSCHRASSLVRRAPSCRSRPSSRDRAARRSPRRGDRVCRRGVRYAPRRQLLSRRRRRPPAVGHGHHDAKSPRPADLAARMTARDIAGSFPELCAAFASIDAWSGDHGLCGAQDAPDRRSRARQSGSLRPLAAMASTPPRRPASSSPAPWSSATTATASSRPIGLDRTYGILGRIAAQLDYWRLADSRTGVTRRRLKRSCELAWRPARHQSRNWQPNTAGLRSELTVSRPKWRKSWSWP